MDTEWCSSWVPALSQPTPGPSVCRAPCCTVGFGQQSPDGASAPWAPVWWGGAASLLLQERGEEPPVEGKHGLGMGPLLGLLEVVLLSP